MLTLEKSTVKSDTLFWKGGLIVMWLLSVQGLHSNSEGLKHRFQEWFDFRTTVISFLLLVWHFVSQDSLMRVCSHGLFFSNSCLWEVYLFGVYPVVYHGYLFLTWWIGCDNIPLFFKGNLLTELKIGQKLSEPFIKITILYLTQMAPNIFPL